MLAAAKHHGKFAGRPAFSSEDIRRAADEGFLFLQTATELDLMHAGARGLLEPLGRWRPGREASREG